MTVNDRRLDRPFILTASSLQTDNLPPTFEQLTLAYCQPLLDTTLDLVLIGTGPQSQRLDSAIQRAFDDANVGVETMHTPAACRSYAALLSEGRAVAGLFFP